MTPEERKELDNLWSAINQLTVQLHDFVFRAEAARFLLIQRGVFSESEYEERLASLRSEWLAVLDKQIDERKATADQIRLRQFFESYRGPQH